MKKWERILFERQGTLGRIVMNRPKDRNAMDRVMCLEMLEALELHLEDPEVRSVEITGAGDAFSAGADLSEMKSFPGMGADDAFDWPAPIVQAHQLMLRAGKPVIAAVNGPAYAGALGLAGMCDIIVATRRSTFATPEVKVGLFPMIIVAHLSRALPRKRLVEMMMTGDPMEAEEAWRLGFVNRLVETPEQLAEAVRGYAKKFENVSPKAIQFGRRSLAVLSELPAHYALETAQFMNLRFFLGEDFREGTSAFLEKRRPKWQKQASGPRRARLTPS